MTKQSNQAGERTQIQLPNDVQSIGYRMVGPFDWQQVFRSASSNFEGTASEFCLAGHGYAYIQTGKFIRATQGA